MLIVVIQTVIKTYLVDKNIRLFFTDELQRIIL